MDKGGKRIIYLASYPKSGNTWLRFILGHYLSEDKVDFSNCHKIIPDFDANPQDIALVKNNPVFAKSHSSYQPDFKKAIYIYRDGRDVSVSYFYHLKGKKTFAQNVLFPEFFWDYFMTGKVFCGDWGKHVESWLDQAGNDILFTSYEKLKNDTFGQMKRLLQFSGVIIDPNRLKQAIDNSSVTEMSNAEKKHKEKYGTYSLEQKTTFAEDFNFVRKGVVGDWRSYYDEKMLKAFEEKYGSLMRRLNYEI